MYIGSVNKIDETVMVYSTFNTAFTVVFVVYSIIVNQRCI